MGASLQIPARNVREFQLLPSSTVPFFFSASLTDMMCYMTVDILLITDGIKDLFVHLFAICTLSSVKWLFKNFAHFKN
jgi:hypothetical protein